MSRYMKSIIGFLGATQAWGVAVTLEKSEGGRSIVGGEWFGLCAVIIAGLLVFGVPNTPPEGEPSDPAVSETDPPAPSAARRRAGSTKG